MYIFKSILDLLQSCDKFEVLNWHILQRLLHKVDFCMQKNPHLRPHNYKSLFDKLWHIQ